MPARRERLRRGQADASTRFAKGTSFAFPQECEASQEGGFPNLFCTRIPRGRYQVIFYEDSVLVWPRARGPDSAPFAYKWKPKGRK